MNDYNSLVDMVKQHELFDRLNEILIVVESFMKAVSRDY